MDPLLRENCRSLGRARDDKGRSVLRLEISYWDRSKEPLRSRGDRSRLEGQTRGIPHLAKNERDVGHPAIVKGIESKGATAVEVKNRKMSVGVSILRWSGRLFSEWSKIALFRRE